LDRLVGTQSRSGQKDKIKSQFYLFLYGCETWLLILREEHRSREFENYVPKTVFGRKREEGAGGWRGLHSGEPRNLWASPNIIEVIKLRIMRWPARVAHVEDLGVSGKIRLEWISGK
jgi:hypothetical protein